MNQLSRLFFVAIVMLIGMVIAVPRPYAAPIIYQTGFEPSTFVPGFLVGQDGWEGVSNIPLPSSLPPCQVDCLSPNAAVISTAEPLQGTQSVLVRGEDLVHQDFINLVTGGYYDAIGSYRRPVNYDTGGTQTVRVSAHVRVDGPQTADDDNFFSASINPVAQGEEDGAPSPTGVGELAISSDGRVHAYTGADQVPTFLTSARVRLGEWHTLAVEANFATRETSFFVDDECLGSFPFDPRVTTDLLLRGSMLTYAAPDTATEHKADYAAHFDQFTIKVVEPEECEVKGADR